MADFSKITERLYCGAAIHSISDLTQIETSGITHIVDAQVEHNDASLLIAGHWPLERYLYDATADDGVHPKPVGWFKATLDFAMPLLSRPGWVVLTHCALGHNRGPSLAYAILRAQGFTSAEALNLLHTGRPACAHGVGYWRDAEAALKTLGWIR